MTKATTTPNLNWVPQTLNAMLGVSVEAILGVVQSGVFMAIVIYAHQHKLTRMAQAERDHVS